jgi:FKBP-type peptidyl-prolyl cis-trans isomerase
MNEKWENNWKDYYKILQVPSAAKQAVISSAFNKLAGKYSAEANKNPGTNEKMNDINEAFNILGDIEKKKKYDKIWLQKKQASNQSKSILTGAQNQKGAQKTVSGKNKSKVNGASKKRKQRLLYLIYGVIGLAIIGIVVAIVIHSVRAGTTSAQFTVTTTTRSAGANIAQSGDTVKVDYTLKLADGTVKDTSIGKTPFEFTLGTGAVIVGFDKAVIGMTVGETKTVVVPAAEGYGATPSASNELAGQDLTFIITLLEIE